MARAVFLSITLLLGVACGAAHAEPKPAPTNRPTMASTPGQPSGPNRTGEADASATTPELSDLYKQLEAFDFRNDEVVDLSARNLQPLLEVGTTEDVIDARLARRVSLPELWAVAFVRNPDLEAMRRMVRARAEMYPQTMYVDALAAQYRSFLQGIDTRTGGGGMGGGNELLFPGPGIISFNGRLARLEVEMALQDYSMKLRDVCAEVFAMASERESLRRTVAVLSETVKVFTSFEVSLRSRFTTDRAMYPEFSRLQAERDRMILERDSMRRMFDAMQPGLNRWLGRRPDAPLGEIVLPRPNPPVPAKNLAARADTSRQEIRIQEIMLEILQTLASLKRRETLSPLSPGFAYPKTGMSPAVPGSPMSMGKGRTDPNSPYRLTFGTMPPAVRTPEYGGPVAYLRELDRRIEAETARLAEMRNALQAEVAAAAAEYENARQGANTETSRVIPSLERGMESAAAGYRTGNVSFLEWMELFMKTLEARLAAIRFDLAARKGLARLMMLGGGTTIHPEF